MIKFTTALFTLLAAAESFAALAPEYQNKRDFDVMLAFIQSHERVISTLKSVDFENTVVYFDEDCIATFGIGGPPHKRVTPKGSPAAAITTQSKEHNPCTTR